MGTTPMRATIEYADYLHFDYISNVVNPKGLKQPFCHTGAFMQSDVGVS